MTTTSSLPFPTMDVPLMDDTMEMVSPYQGHADDFEIDIDVMEDQASNPDRDMTAADDYMDSSYGANYDHEGSPDEDMIDDAAEPYMIDPDEYPEANPNVDKQYEEGQTYETQMLEDEYDEDIDAPVPVDQEEVSTSPEHANTQEGPRASPTRNNDDSHEDNGKIPVVPLPQTGIDTVDQTRPESQQDPEQTVEQDDQRPTDDWETAHAETSHTVEAADNTNKTEQADLETAHGVDHSNNTEELQRPVNEERDLNQSQPSIDEPKEAEGESHERDRISGSNDEKAEQEHDSAGYPPLYPVKVYYQDNEISLFPPREGDSSETFFLEDESLAYGSFGNLFEACREVLRDHVNDNEVLVMDIEALNLQLTEDSLQTNQATLKQIVDVYLQLCHNDGIDEPEALYLTLGTKPTIAAELSDLSLAASEGKGLSEIHSWDEYPEAEGASAEFEETAQESYPEEPHDALDTGDNRDDQGDLDDSEPDSASHNQAVPSPQQDEPEPRDEENFEHVEIVESDDVTIKASEAEPRNDTSLDPGSPHTAARDFEEQQTDSTATVEPLPPTEISEERPELGELTELAYDGDDLEDEYHERGKPDDEFTPEEGSYVNAAEPIDAFEEAKETNVEGLAEGHQKEYHDLEVENDGHPLLGEIVANDAPHDSEDVIQNTLQVQDSFKETKPTLDGSSPTSKSSQTTRLVDDLLGTTDNLLESLGNDSKPVGEQPGVGDANEPGELDENSEHAQPLLPNDEDATDLRFDDEDDYLDLGITEGLGDFDEDANISSPSRVSAKRSREPDDALDLPGSTTPEVKRSRSS